MARQRQQIETEVAQQQTAPRLTGPLVYRDMDQQELDDGYDQTKWATNQPLVGARRVAASEAARARIGAPQRIAYGPSDAERLDLYATKAPNAPIHIFVHGGGWRRGAASEWAAPAEAFVNAGAHFIALDFAVIDDVGGDVEVLVDQVRRAVAWVAGNAANFGGDAARIHLTGHSSGAQLASVVLTTDWAKAFGLPADTIKSALVCSGMYDLEPVRLSKRSAYVTFSDAMVERCSAIRCVDRITARMLVGHATHESPEFIRQAREFVAALEAAGKPVTLLVGDSYNHFEIIETLANPYGLLGRAVLEEMGLVNASPGAGARSR